jgi:peptidyl-prolyl cis-trans isomerase D
MIRFLQTQGTTQRILLIGFLSLVCIAMVVTLIPGVGVGGSSVTTEGIYATVGDEQISTQQIDQMADRMGRSQFPKGYPEQFRPFLRSRAADSLLNTAALANEARRLGLKVTDEELKQELHQGFFGQQFFPDGKFIGQEQYEAFVANNFGVRVSDFERLMKQDIIIRKLQAVVEGGVTVSKDEIQKELERQNTKVKFDYAVLSVPDLMKQVTVNDAELKAYYDAHLSQFKDSVPEERKVQYIAVTPQSVPVQITEDDYKKAYQEHQDQFRVPETVDVRHILISTPKPGPDGKVDQKAVDAAEAKAKDIEKQLKAGGDFAKLAKQYSEDPGSKDNGGLYTGVTKGQMVGEFDKAAFSLPVGQISDPVKTTFGYHVMRVDKHEQPHVKPLEQAKAELEPMIRQEKSQKLVDQLAAQVEEGARSKSMEQAAADHHLQVNTTAYVPASATLPGLGPSPVFMQEAFAAKVGAPPSKVTLASGYAIFRVLDSKPARTPSFEEMKAQLEGQYRNEKARALLSKKSQELADRAHATHDLKTAAKEVGATFKTSDLVSASSQVPDLGQMSGPAEVAFSMKPGDISNAIENGTSAAVLQVKDIQKPSADEMAKAQESTREQMLQQRRNQVMQIFAASLVERLKKDKVIRINAEEAKRMKLTQMAG